MAALATLGRKTTKPRSAMSAAEVRAVIVAAEWFDQTAGVAFPLASITGARGAGLCALVRADLDERIVVVRGGALDATLLAVDVRKTFAVYGV